MQLREDWLLIKEQVANIQSEVADLVMPPTLVSMLIAAEDHRFGWHIGVDPISVCRAAHRTIFGGRREGASTIAMQLVRVLTSRYEKTLKRKFEEMCLAVRLTMYVQEADIPKLYLYVAYFGWRMNGLVQASHRLNIDLSAMSEFDAASIIARLKYPEPQKYDQIRLGKIRVRTTHILSRAIALTAANQPYQSQLGDINGTL